MKKTIKWLAITLLIVLVLVMLAGMYKFNYLAYKEGYNCDGNKVEKSIDFSPKYNNVKEKEES